MSSKHVITEAIHLKCDMCKKEEVIELSNTGYVPDFLTRKWSKLSLSQYPEYNNTKTIDLCPTCTRKIKKLIKNITLEEDELTDGSN